MARVMKISEKELVQKLASFLRRNELVEQECHFDGDDEGRADIELCLSAPKWPADFPEWLFIEAKSHHSTDAPNTINKIFGQLLKETGKNASDRAKKKYALAVVFPSEKGEWESKGGSKQKTLSGEDYYRQGFSRIDPRAYSGFGELVNVKYVMSFSSTEQCLRVFDWVGFRRGGQASQDPLLK